VIKDNAKIKFKLKKMHPDRVSKVKTL